MQEKLDPSATLFDYQENFSLQIPEREPLQRKASLQFPLGSILPKS